MPTDWQQESYTHRRQCQGALCHCIMCRCLVAITMGTAVLHCHTSPGTACPMERTGGGRQTRGSRLKHTPHPQHLHSPTAAGGREWGPWEGAIAEALGIALLGRNFQKPGNNDACLVPRKKNLPNLRGVGISWNPLARHTWSTNCR